jgi:U32 family peptidase
LKLTTYGTSLHDLNQLKDKKFDEVILGAKSFSRFGKLNFDQFVQMAKRSKELGLRVLFEWDVLMTEDVFEKKIVEISDYLPFVDSIRVQDPGALLWVIENTNFPIQFIAESGNHNLKALEGWIEISSGRLERLVLSIELPKSIILDYLQKLSVPCEILGLGRILLFYTPRSLLSPLIQDKMSYHDELAVIGESEESPHKGFPILENHHGTFMFHIKEFCLLDYAIDLSEMGLGFFRIDQRWIENHFLDDITKLITDFDESTFESFKARYPQELMRGFYLVNKTDVLFPKLKNARLQKREADFIGEVIEAEKGSHLAIMVRNPRGLKKSDELKIIHPKGDIFEAKIYSLKNIIMEEVDEVPAGQLAVIQFIGGIWVKSQVFYR